jgi:putative membrane protein
VSAPSPKASLPKYDDAVPGAAGVVEDATPQDAGSEVPWRRLDVRVIWADALRVLVSLMPTGIAVLAVGVDFTMGTMWPVLGIAVYGIVGATADVLRWVKTRYRITEDYVERRTGWFTKRYRSIRRDRIRSVDADAKFRHRVARLRILRIGAGQQNAAGESALVLDAVSRADAERLRHELLDRRTAAPSDAAAEERAAAVESPALADSEVVLARIRWSWIAYNLFNVWAYAMALGLLWGLAFLLPTFGLNPVGFVVELGLWDRIGWAATVAIAVVGIGLLGVLGLAVNFVSESWKFELTRVPGENGTVLRTTQGLFRRREINRDDSRLRGVLISEPLLWRWMRMADTSVITTGLSIWSTASTIIPRGPREVARRVAAAVLDADPFAAPLRRHPATALWRRLGWAIGVATVLTLVAVWVSSLVEAVPGWAWLAMVLVSLPLALGLAVASYRALGHAVSGEYVITRSGVMAWGTAALKRRAVSGVTVRQSILQRRLGLMSVSMSTAAGYGTYAAPDMSAADAVAFADAGSAGMLAPFIDVKAADSH